MVLSLWRRLLTNGSLASRIAPLLAGTVIGQAVPVLVSPILTRLFHPEQFGVLAVFSAICMSMISLVTLRYEYGLLLARTAEQAAAALVTCLLVAFGNALLALLVVSALSFEAIFGLPSLDHIKFLLPLALVLVSAYQIFVYEATRVGRFGPIARTKLIQGCAGPATQIGLGLLGAGTTSLVIGFIASQALGTLSLFREFVRPQWASLRQVDLRRIRSFARQHIRFPLLSSWSGVLQEAGNGYLVIVLAMLLFEPTIAGYLFLADRIVGRPLLIVTSSTLQIMAGDFSNLLKQRSDTLLRSFLRVALGQFVIAALWCALVAAVVPLVAVPLFGPMWGDAVPYVQILCVAYLFQATMHALSPLLQLMERQSFIAISETIRWAAIVGALVCTTALGWTPLAALKAYVWVQVLFQVVSFTIMAIETSRLQNGWSQRTPSDIDADFGPGKP